MEHVTNIKKSIDENNFIKFTDEFIVTPTNESGELLVEYSKSCYEINYAISTAKDLWEYLKEHNIEVKEILIEYELTGYDEQDDLENVDTVTVFTYSD